MTTIFIPGVPVAQPRQRQRVATINGRPMAMNYTPSKDPVNDFKAAIKMAWFRSAGIMLDGPVEMRLLFVFPRPKSKTKKRGDSPPEWKTSKPDIDNLAKAVMDSLNGLAYIDDAQVCSQRIEKVIASKDYPAVTRIEVVSLDGVAAPLMPLKEAPCDTADGD